VQRPRPPLRPSRLDQQHPVSERTGTEALPSLLQRCPWPRRVQSSVTLYAL
jgi:hypothetical protein